MLAFIVKMLGGFSNVALNASPDSEMWAFAQSPVLFTLSRSMSQKTRVKFYFLAMKGF